MIDSTKKVFVAGDRDDIIGTPLYLFSTPSEFASAKIAMEKVFKTGQHRWHAYNIHEHSYLYLITLIDKDTLATHEVIDDPNDRPRLKRFLWVASGNWYRQLYKKDVG